MPRPTLPGRRPMAPSDRRVSERGQLLVIFALAMVALIGMVGLIIDGGDTALQRRDQQNVADAAAMAAGYAYVNGLDETAAAHSVAAANGYVDGTDSTIVSVNIGADSITVDVSRPHRNYFSGLLGFSSWDVSTTATVLAGVPNGAYGAMPIIFNMSAFLLPANNDPNAPVSFEEPPPTQPDPKDVPLTDDAFNWTVFGTAEGNDDNENTNIVSLLINDEGTSTTIFKDDPISPLNAGSHTGAFNALSDYLDSHPGAAEFPVAIVDDSGALQGWAWFHLTGSVGGNTKEISGYFDSDFNPAPMTIVQGHGDGSSAFPPIVHLID